MRRGVRVQRHGHLPGLARLQLDLRPTRQPSGRLARAGGQSEVDLGDLGTRPCTSIRDREAHLYGRDVVDCLRFYLQLRIREARVGEPVAERKERFDPQLVIASVTDSEAFVKVGDVLCPGVLLW